MRRQPLDTSSVPSVVSDETATTGLAPDTGPEPAAAFVQGTLLDRYVILDLVGRGGMGVVYAAYDPKLDRKVALKLLHPGRTRATEKRLEREAQALAKLADPNVIAVYDVGSWEGRLFLAMEYVPGVTLHEYFAEPRSWREIVAVFEQAGRGLAAAHEAGLVHRDFKANNVMVRGDGRALVLDFGLARAESLSESRESVIDVDTLEHSSGTLPPAILEETLTQAGTVLGTPSYMAPEQHAGRQVGPAADQFSFSVALYQALYGEHPFAGARGAGRERWTVREPPSGSRVPAWLRRILLRGLRHEPTARYTSMRAMLRDLAKDPGRRRRRGFAAAALLALPILAGWLYLGALDARRSLCRDAAEKLTGIWDAERRQALEAAFSATGKAQAESAWTATATRLDAYRDDWVAMHRAACEATHLRGEQSAELLDRRMECLDQNRRELEALVRLLTEDAGTVVERAVEAVFALSDLSRCADTKALMAPLAPPEDATTTRVTDTRRTLSRVKVLFDAGRYEEGVASARAAVETAGAIGYWPLVAEAQLLLGRFQERRAESADAAATLERALRAAQAGRHDRVAAEAFTRLVRVKGFQQADLDAGHYYAGLARGLLDHLSRPEEIEATLADHVGVLLFQEGKHEAAFERHRRALALREDVYGPDHPAVAGTLTRMSNVLLAQGILRDARQLLERALAINEAAFGRFHPEVASSLERLGTVLRTLAEYEEARAHYDRALAIGRASLGPRHPRVAATATSLGSLVLELGDPAAALGHYREALEIQEAVLGGEHPDVASTLANIGLALAGLGRDDEALASYGRALEICEKAYGRDDFRYGYMLYNLGEIHNDLGDFGAGYDSHQVALDVWRRVFGEDHYLIAHGLTGLGRSLDGLGRPAQAVPALERALVIWRGAERDPAFRAETLFRLARALDALGREPERVDELIATARELYGRSAVNSEARDELEAWLAGRE